MCADCCPACCAGCRCRTRRIKVANVAGVDPNKPQRACDVCYARVAAGGPAVKPATEADSACGVVCWCR